MKPGDKIVCVDAKSAGWTSMPTGLVEGEIYTVRSYGPYRHYIDGDFIGVRLIEIDRGDDPAGLDVGDMPFRASRFRPVVKPRVEKEKRIEETV